MQKYRIVPQQENMFWQLVQGMTLDDEEKTLLKNAVIRHVEVSVKAGIWEIALTSQTLIPDSLLQRAAEQIKGKCSLQKPELHGGSELRNVGHEFFQQSRIAKLAQFATTLVPSPESQQS